MNKDEELQDVVKLATAPNGPIKQQSSGIADINLDSLRLDQSFDQIIGVQPVLTTVDVRKPKSQEWFRVHPDPAWRLHTAMLELKEERESYLIARNLWNDLWDEILPTVLYTAVAREGEVFLWPVRLPRDGRMDKFIETDLRAAKAAETQWVRRYWVPGIKSHKVSAANNLSENPVWPEAGFAELLETAFRDRFIRGIDHPVIKKLRGEI